MTPLDFKEETAAIREIIEQNREELTGRCAEDLLECGPFSATMEDANLNRVSAFIIEAVLNSLESEEDEFLKWSADFMKRAREYLPPYSEIMQSLRKTRAHLRGFMLSGCELSQDLIRLMNHLDDGVDRLIVAISHNYLLGQTQRFQIVYEHLVTACAFMDPWGRLVTANSAFKELLGYSEDELFRGLGHVFEQEEDARRFEKTLVTTMEKGVSLSMEAKLKSKSGEIKWAKIHAVPMDSGEMGAALGLVMFQDVTEHKLAAEKANLQKDLLAEAEKLAMVGAWEWHVAEDVWNLSENWQDIHGADCGKMSTPELVEMAHPMDLPAIEAALADTLAGRKGYALEHRIVRRDDGEIRHIKVMGEMEFDSMGQPVRMYGAAQDITEQINAEQAQRDTLALLNAAGKIAKVGGWIYAPHSREVLWSEETYRIHGKGPEYRPKLEEALEYYHPDDRPVLAKALNDATKSGEPFDLELRFTSATGEKLETRVTCEPEVRDGRTVLLRGAMQDITARKRAQEAIKEREELLRSMVRGIRAAFFRVDKKTRKIVEANPMGLEILGVDEREVIGSPCADVLKVQGCGRICEDSGGGERILGREYVLIRPDGVFVPISLSVLEMSVKGFEYIVFVFFDISERKDLERRLAISQRLESVGQLAAGIAHEINTPIQFIANNMGFLKEANDYFSGYIKTCENMFKEIQQDEDMPDAVKLAMSKREEEELAFYLDQSNLSIEESWDGVQRITSIVDSMRYFSHPGGEEKTSVDLNGAVENTVTVTKNEWKYAAELVLDLDPDLPVINGFPADISQAVLNLVVNAAHAVSERFAGTEDKGVIMLKTYAEDGDVVIEVMDNGGGIPKNIQPRVFDPFYTTKAVGKGTGQGLAIVHSAVVDKHGGSVDLRSEPGQGATFIIRLPIVD